MMNPIGLARSLYRIRIAALVALGLLVFPSAAYGQKGRQGKQERERSRAEVAAQYKPPPGMCRIWLEGVPGSRQPAPTACATALRDRPANGRVIFGDDLPKAGARTQKGKGRKSGND